MSSTRSSNSVHFTLSVVMAATILLVAPMAAAQTPAQPRRPGPSTTRQPGAGSRSTLVGSSGAQGTSSRQPGGRPSAGRPSGPSGGARSTGSAAGAGGRPSAAGAGAGGRPSAVGAGRARGGGGATSSSFGTPSGGFGGSGGVASGAFEPYRNEPIEWKDIPDEGKQIIMLDAPTMAVPEFLQTIALNMEWTVVMGEGVGEKQIHAWFNKISVRDALKVLRFANLYYEYDKESNVLTVTLEDEYYLDKYGDVERFEFDVQHADVVDMQSLVEAMMSPQGRVIADTRLSRLIVFDTEHNLEYVKQLLKALDVKIKPVIIPLQYVDADAVLDEVTYLLTQQGIATTDLRTNKLIVSDIPEGINRVLAYVEAVDVEVVTRTFEMKYALVEDVETMLNDIILEGMGLIQVDQRMRQVTVTTTPQKMKETIEIIEMLDKQSRQVHIKAYIMRANADLIRNLGIQWSQLGKLADDKSLNIAINPSTGLASISTAGPLAAPGVVGEIISESGYFNALITALLTDSDTDVLSEPEITVSDGLSATFGVTTLVPYLSGSSVQYSSTGQTSGADPTDPSRYYRYFPQRVQTAKVGISLQVKPTINLLGDVNMELSVEDSDFIKVDLPGVGGVPQIRSSNVSTSVLVASGSTVILGGLRGGRREDSVEKVPILGDIPFIGRAFKSTEQKDSYQELMIFITPTVIGLESSAVVDDLDEFRQQLLDRSEVIRRWPLTGLGKEPHKEPHQELEPVPRRGLVGEDDRETQDQQQ